MSRLRRLALASGAWLLAQGACAGALETLDQCAAQAPADVVGIAALEAQCPGIGAALAELGFTASLPAAAAEHLRAAGLRDLAGLAHRYRDTPVAAPDTTSLPAVLAQLAREQAAPAQRSWWSALLEKVRSWFGQREPGSISWLDRLLEGMARYVDFMQVMTYLLLTIIVGIIAYYAIRELRASGVLRSRVRDGRQETRAPVGDATQPLPDLDAVAAHEQPALLLRLLVARLRARGELQQERSLTHAELAAQGIFRDGESRHRFERVTRLAERVLYGPGRPDPAQVADVVHDGRQLLLQLEGMDR